MIVKTQEISDFLKEHYSPGTIDTTDKKLQLTNNGVLNLLFSVFPEDCIDSYELHEILTNLGYKPQKKTSTDFVWCFVEKHPTPKTS